MRASTQSERYTRVAIALHWAIAACIVFDLSIGFWMEDLPAPWHFRVVGWHVSAGMTALALTAIRILWRLTHKPPLFPGDMKPWEVKVAHSAHLFIYFLMVALPITGWSIVSAHPPRPGAGVNVWGLLLVPRIEPIENIADVDYQKVLHDDFVEIHSIGSWIMIAVLILHVAAALKHQFIDRQPQLVRMGIGKPST